MTDIQLRRLGNTEIFVSPVALGCWPIAGMTSLDTNDADSLATIGAAMECGINFLDTAYMYGADGKSERLIGEVIRDRREEVVIASKGGIHWNGQLEKTCDARPARIVRECDESLQRMGIDTIDLHYLHAPDANTPIAETAGAFVSLLEAGKIRSVGASNLNVDQLTEFHTVCPIAAVQMPYNMLQRNIEDELVPWCVERQISVVAYWPLMKGLLAGKIRRGHSFDPQDTRRSYEVFQGPAFARAQNLLDELDKIAVDLGKTVAEIVVNWTISRCGITSTLCGAKRAWQIEETAAAMCWQMDQENLSRIERFLSEIID